MAVIPKIDWREIVYLYGLTLLTVTGFFLLGLYVGRSFPVEAEPARFTAPSGSGSSSSQTKPQLEFYGRLNDPASRGADAPGSETSPEPLEGTAGPGAQVNAQGRPSGAHRFTVQIAAMEREAEARKELVKVRSRGYLAEIHRLGPNDRFFRVWVGDFPTKQQADRLANRLYEDGFMTFVRRMAESP